MRMWNVDVRKMCRQHLLGEHLELHMFAANIRKGRNVKGYVKNGLVEVHNIKKRHDNIVSEMKKRGYCHRTPMRKFKAKRKGKINVKESIRILRKRCRECRKMFS